MGESLYGKFGVSIVKAGFIILIMTIIVTLMFGFILPGTNINMFFLLSFLVLIVGIVLGIVGIIRDDLREKAIRSLIAGILFLIVGIAFVIFYNTFFSPLFG